MIDKTIERIIKIPRVRVSDCCRLIFRLGGGTPEWRDMDQDPDLYPIYPLPPLSRKTYSFLGKTIKVSPGMTINDLVKEVCQVYRSSDREYLYEIIFRKTGELEIKIEII